MTMLKFFLYGLVIVVVAGLFAFFKEVRNAPMIEEDEKLIKDFEKEVE